MQLKGRMCSLRLGNNCFSSSEGGNNWRTRVGLDGPVLAQFAGDKQLTMETMCSNVAAPMSGRTQHSSMYEQGGSPWPRREATGTSPLYTCMGARHGP